MGFYRRYRTIILGSVATLLLLAAAVFSFDVDWREIAAFLGYSLLLLGVVILAAALLVGLLVLLRRLIRGPSDRS